MSPTRYLEKAERALGGAELLLQAGEIEGACNRAYYAMYDAAHAALLAVSAVDFKTTKTHRGLIAAFGHQLIQTNLLPRALGRSLNEVEQVRLLADYTGDDVTAATALWAVEQARVFVAAVSVMLQNAGTPPAV
jgi:uncharacterized protein (UPF0332 family)